MAEVIGFVGPVWVLFCWRSLQYFYPTSPQPLRMQSYVTAFIAHVHLMDKPMSWQLEGRDLP
jgi:hypothetical protein